MCAQHPPHGCWTLCGPTVASTWETGWGIWGRRAQVLLGCPSLTLLCLSFPPCTAGHPCPPSTVSFGFAKGPVRSGVELNTFLIPSWSGGGICSPPLDDRCPRSPSPQVQGVPGRAVAAVALPPAALLGFLLAASPEHWLPPPHPRPGATAAAACGITQGLAGAGRGRQLGGTHSPSLLLPHTINHQNPRLIKLQEK